MASPVPPMPAAGATTLTTPITTYLQKYRSMASPVPPMPAAGATTLTTPITTYLQKYHGQGDVLEGRYQEFLAPYSPHSGGTHAQLEARIIATMSEVPKVFLGLVEHAGVTSSITLHRPTQYASHPVDTSIWDGLTLAFAGDVQAGTTSKLSRCHQPPSK